MNVWEAAIHVLSSPLLLQKCRKYVNVEDREINVSQMLSDAEATWSSGEVIMARIAADFYNGGGNTNIGDVLRTLDRRNLQVVLDAIAIYTDQEQLMQTILKNVKNNIEHLEEHLEKNDDEIYDVEYNLDDKIVNLIEQRGSLYAYRSIKDEIEVFLDQR